MEDITDMYTEQFMIRMNTPELRDFLETVGYEYVGGHMKTDGNIIVCVKGRWNTEDAAPDEKPRAGMTDCGTDIRLFRTLAVMNDSTDLDQWFLSEGWKHGPNNEITVTKWVLCTLSSLKLFGCVNNSPNTYDTKYVNWRKATADELTHLSHNPQWEHGATFMDVPQNDDSFYNYFYL